MELEEIDFDNFDYPEKCPKCGEGNLIEALCPSCCDKILEDKKII